jgi:hypothetical protein
MRHKLYLLLIVLIRFGLAYSPFCLAEGYELGQGWNNGKYFLSGYVNLEFVDRFQVPTRLDLDDLSLFAAGRINRWINPFTEIELSKYTLIQEGGGAEKGDIVVERFYNDSKISERDTLQVGKILTPLGDWNQVHAAPLVPTVTRPYSTARGFSSYMSGVNWMHDPESSVVPEFQLYWQPGDEFFKRPVSQTTRNFHDVYGGFFNLPLNLIDKVGVSFQHGQLIETGETFTLFGFNANKAFGDLMLESEAETAGFTGTVLPGASPRVHDKESGMFVLADYSLTPRWHGILEGEYYQDHTVDDSSRNTLIAVAYKQGAAAVWKLEYIYQAGVPASFAPITTGIKASFSTLF